jgi:hypothetical protein
LGKGLWEGAVLLSKKKKKNKRKEKKPRYTRLSYSFDEKT